MKIMNNTISDGFKSLLYGYTGILRRSPPNVNYPIFLRFKQEFNDLKPNTPKHTFDLYIV